MGEPEAAAEADEGAEGADRGVGVVGIWFQAHVEDVVVSGDV